MDVTVNPRTTILREAVFGPTRGVALLSPQQLVHSEPSTPEVHCLGVGRRATKAFVNCQATRCHHKVDLQGKRWNVTEAVSFKIVVNVEVREDGGLRVWSADVPGLVLSNKNPEKVISDIKPALEAILSAYMGCNIRAEPLRPLEDMLAERKRVMELAEAPKTKSAPRRAHNVRPEAPPYVRSKTLEYAAQPCH